MKPRNEPANDACVVRPAEVTDAVLLQHVLDEASGTENASIHGDDAFALMSKHRVYLGFVEDAAVGCVMATVDNDVAIIHNLAVSVHHRNRGHATTLVKSVMSLLDEPIPRTYWAAADPGNPSAVRRFHTLGFSTHEEDFPRNVILMVRHPTRPFTAVATLHRSRPSMPMLDFGTIRTGTQRIEVSASND